MLMFGLIINTPPVIATTILPVDLQELITEAEIIFTGTVTKVESLWGMDGRIYTEVTFDDLNIIKGIHPENIIVMELAGGTIDEHHSKVFGMPEFQAGGKHLIFMHGNRKYICPIVGWSQGKFNIVPDKVTGAEVILDDNNNPVTGVEGSTILKMPQPVEKRGESFPGVSEEHGVPPVKALQAVDTGKRLSIQEFIPIIEGIMGISGERRMP